jgi:hypothetical protein
MSVTELKQLPFSLIFRKKLFFLFGLLYVSFNIDSIIEELLNFTATAACEKYIKGCKMFITFFFFFFFFFFGCKELFPQRFDQISRERLTSDDRGKAQYWWITFNNKQIPFLI